MPTWPLTLQQKINEDSFGIKKGETVVRSDMDTGPKKSRRRFTRAIDVLSLSIDLKTEDEYDDLEFFYNTTVNGGVTPFDFVHPITQVTGSFRFNGPPSYTSLGGGVFRASMEWDIL